MGVRITVRTEETRTDPDAVYEFDQARVVIGRGHGADVRLPHPSVSHAHAIVRQQDFGYVLVDEETTNGTRVNGQRLVPGRPKPLRNGDRLRVGVFELVFDSGVPVPDSTSAERTAALARRFVREAWTDEEGAAGPPRLVVIHGPDAGSTLELPLPPARLLLGRAEGCDLVLSDADASREHLAVTSDLEGLRIEDLGSKNGMTVNDRPVSQRRLRDRDEIALGSTVLVFEDPADERLRALDERADLELPSEPEPEAAPDPEPAAPDTGEPAPPVPGAPPSPPRSSGPRMGADLAIYLLAGSVFALSLLGLFLLLQG